MLQVRQSHHLSDPLKVKKLHRELQRSSAVSVEGFDNAVLDELVSLHDRIAACGVHG